MRVLDVLGSLHDLYWALAEVRAGTDNMSTQYFPDSFGVSGSLLFLVVPLWMSAVQSDPLPPRQTQVGLYSPLADIVGPLCSNQSGPSAERQLQ